jgi:hypothetical protein
MLNACEENYLGERTKQGIAVTPVMVDFSAWLASLPKDPASLLPEVLQTVSWGASIGSTVTIVNNSNTATSAFAQLAGGLAGFGQVTTIAIDVTTSRGNRDTFWYRVNTI